MSQITPIKPTQTSNGQTSAIPQALVKGRRPHPFGLLFSGHWRFDGVRKIWRPRMNLVNLIPGCNGVIETGVDQRGLKTINAGSYIDKASKTTLAKFFVTGDRRLGQYAEFQRIYTVKTPGGRQVPHYALPCEQYHRDQHGRVGRSFDHVWLDGLFEHMLKTDLIPPMDYGSFELAFEKLKSEIQGLKDRALRRGSNREALIERIDQLTDRAKAMKEAFDAQFPKALELWKQAEKEAVEGDGYGSVFDPEEDDTL